LTPITRIIVDRGRELACNPLVPRVFHIDGFLVARAPDVRRIPTPGMLQPTSDNDLSFDNFKHMGKAGLYSTPRRLWNN